MDEALQLRVHGDASLPTLIYLPGLHGDWTLIGGFRHALGDKVPFVEVTYPRTLTWSLDDYAAAIETALAANGVTGGWLLGESFGSQVVWAMVAREKFPAQGVILAGGFVKYPNPALGLMEKITERLSTRALVWIIFGYAEVARFRYHRSPQTLAMIDEFIARRTELDRRAAQHRLRLVAQSDPRAVAINTRLPVFGLTGFFDPIVPWPRVRRWLKRNCPGLRDYRIIWRADHNVLSTAPQEAARQIWEWISR
ncbi:MAG TPA: alpha/beta hydrolase [Candidatus Saccharimonadales bacterium]|nr:alpha/beta hydrolase [Candidatus Saccharimonadales bacterium]